MSNSIKPIFVNENGGCGDSASISPTSPLFQLRLRLWAGFARLEATAGKGFGMCGERVVALDEASAERFRADGARILAPGMAVTVDIKTGERRLIEYLLAPILRYENESLRDR